MEEEKNGLHEMSRSEMSDLTSKIFGNASKKAKQSNVVQIPNDLFDEMVCDWKWIGFNFI